MDIAKLLSSGMRSCGRVLNVLPQKEIGSPMEYMMRILREETLPSLDILIPRLLTKTFPIYALTKVGDGDDSISGGNGPSMDSRYCAFRVPRDLVDGCDILGVKDCFEAYATNDCSMYADSRGYGSRGMYANRYGRISSAAMYASAYANMLSYADAQLVGTMKPQLKSKFFQPNILWINKPYCDNEELFITVTFKLKNDENLITVSDTAYEGIRKLFILDLRKSIYNEYGHLCELDTPSGPINLKADEWSGAENDRDSLFETYLGSAHFRNSSMRSG